MNNIAETNPEPVHTMKVGVLRMSVSLTSLNRTIQQVIAWALKNESRYICVSNVHMCMEVFDDPQFADIVNEADLTVPDGRPIYWAQILMGYKEANQVRGADLTDGLCEAAEDKGIRIGFYGSTQEVLSNLKDKLHNLYPKLEIRYLYAPPFRPLSEKETSAVIATINDSKVQILFVGLGCPKQEAWMANNKNEVSCTMLGVGAAFDFISENKKNAPGILEKIGLEWMYRLICEPGRLWKRYLKHNPRFLFYFLLQLLGKKY